MADKVGVKEAEYQQMYSKICTIHEDNIAQITAALKQISGLTVPGGGFHTSDLTPKVNMIVKEMEQISSSISEVYSAHEMIVSSFQSAIDNYDTCC